MTKFFHIVQVHPVENGEPNLYKIAFEKEFEYKDDAELYIASWNHWNEHDLKAVYVGCVNNETGELV